MSKTTQPYTTNQGIDILAVTGIRKALEGLFKNSKYKQPFKIVAHSGKLPKELKQFVSTVEQVDKSYRE